MKKILKNLTPFGLSILILWDMFGLKSHLPIHNAAPGMCNTDCDNQEHHSIVHQLEKWTDKETKVHFKKYIDFSFDELFNPIHSLDENNKNYFVPFNLYSRPPPSIL